MAKFVQKEFPEDEKLNFMYASKFMAFSVNYNLMVDKSCREEFHHNYDPLEQNSKDNDYWRLRNQIGYTYSPNGFSFEKEIQWFSKIEEKLKIPELEFEKYTNTQGTVLVIVNLNPFWLEVDKLSFLTAVMKYRYSLELEGKQNWFEKFLDGYCYFDQDKVFKGWKSTIQDYNLMLNKLPTKPKLQVHYNNSFKAQTVDRRFGYDIFNSCTSLLT